MTFIAPIVEGSGEYQAVEKLLWRIAAEVAPGAPLRVNEPIRVPSGSLSTTSGSASGMCFWLLQGTAAERPCIDIA